MQKILFVITKDDVGGAQKYVQELASQLDATKFDIKTLTGGKDGIQFLSNSFHPHFLFVNDLIALAELALRFRREKPSFTPRSMRRAPT